MGGSAEEFMSIRDVSVCIRKCYSRLRIRMALYLGAARGRSKSQNCIKWPIHAHRPASHCLQTIQSLYSIHRYTLLYIVYIVHSIHRVYISIHRIQYTSLYTPPLAASNAPKLAVVGMELAIAHPTTKSFFRIRRRPRPAAQEKHSFS